MGTSQASGAKIEAADPPVSLDLVVRAFEAGEKRAAYGNMSMTLEPGQFQL